MHINLLQRGGEFIRNNTEEIAAAGMLGMVVACGGMAIDGFVHQQQIESQQAHTTNPNIKDKLKIESRKAGLEGGLGVLGGIIFSFPAMGEIVDVRNKHRLGAEEFYAQKRDYTLVP